jgi:hydrogenase maturation protease
VTRRAGSWEPLERPAPDAVTVDGVELRRGSRVRLHPRAGADVWDLALDGREAIVEGLEQDVDDGQVQLTVVVADDPGRDLGLRRRPGHRFFFTPGEVEPLGEPGPDPGGAAPARVLVAGIGNVFLGDDGFGVALADRLARTALPAGVEVVDYGIRGMDLAYALLEGWDAVVLLDATPCGKAPGTLYVIEPDLDLVEPAFDAHGMDPVTVLALARALGGTLPRTLVVGCEPLTRMTGDEPEVVAVLSEPVRAALDAAVPLAEELLGELTTTEDRPEGGRPT